MSSPAPGWNPDPSGRHEYRYWDGSNWTDDVSDNGVTSTDPLAGAGGPGAPGGPGYPAEQAPTAPFEPTQAYGQGPGTPGYDQPGGYPPSGGYPPAGPGGDSLGPGGSRASGREVTIHGPFPVTTDRLCLDRDDGSGAGGNVGWVGSGSAPLT